MSAALVPLAECPVCFHLVPGCTARPGRRCRVWLGWHWHPFTLAPCIGSGSLAEPLTPGQVP